MKLSDRELQLKAVAPRRAMLQFMLGPGIAWAALSAGAMDSNALRAVTKPAKSEVRVNEAFQVALRVENPTATNQTVRVMNCSWDEHWKSSNTNVSWLGWACAKNFAVNVDIPPGGAYTNQIDLLVLETAHEGALSFRMGFTPIESTTTFWSDEVRLNVHPPESSSTRLLLGTWREYDSTNTIEFETHWAKFAPILKIRYSVQESQLVLEKPASVVIEKLDVRVYANRAEVKQLRTHNEAPYTNWSVPFRVTQDELEIRWDDQPIKYVRMSK